MAGRKGKREGGGLVIGSLKGNEGEGRESKGKIEKAKDKM